MPGSAKRGWGVPTEDSDIVMTQRKDLVLDSYTNGLLYLQLETELKQKMLVGEYAVGNVSPLSPNFAKSMGLAELRCGVPYKILLMRDY